MILVHNNKWVILKANFKRYYIIQREKINSPNLVNRDFLALYAVKIFIIDINVAFTTGGHNQTASLIEAEILWTPE